MIAFLVLSVTGCTRMHAEMEVSSDDLVTGTVIAAALPASPDDQGPKLSHPSSLASKITVESYKADGYVGSRMTFTELTFDQLSQLTSMISRQSSHYQLNLRRSGELVTLSGSADLSQLPPDRVDIQLAIKFPGTIVNTDGVQDSDGTIVWKPKPGGVTRLNATVNYGSTNSTSWSYWMVIVASGAGLVAVLVALLAYLAHRRSLRIRV